MFFVEEDSEEDNKEEQDDYPEKDETSDEDETIYDENVSGTDVSGFIAQLVERRTGIARSRVQAPLKS